MKVNVICEAVEVILRVQWGQETCLWVWGGRFGGCQGVPGGHEGIQGIPLGHRIGLMSLFMIHKAYMPVYKWSRFFLRTGRTGRTDGTGPTEGSTRGPRGPKNLLIDFQIFEEKRDWRTQWKSKGEEESEEEKEKEEKEEEGEREA